MKKLPRIVKVVGIVTLISALGKLLGFGREAIIAAFFGTSQDADVFFVASMIPTILFTALGTAIQAGIIPLYVKEKAKNQRSADYMMSTLGTLFLVVAVFIVIFTFIFAKPIVQMIAPGFNVKQLLLAEKLTRIMIPSLLFFTLTSVAIGILNANKKFVLPAFTATAQNLTIIIVTLLFAKSFGVVGLAVGMLVGAASQFLIQLPSLTKYDIKFNFNFKKEKETINQTLLLFYPIIIASVAVQFTGVTDRIISSGLDEGSVSAINYAYRLLWLPLSVILTPIITVLYPNIVEAALRGKEDFFVIVTRGSKTIIFLSIPFALVMIINGETLIQIAFERGSFDAVATQKTAEIFLFYTVGLVFFALRDYLMNCFYALKENKMVMISCIVTVILQVTLSVVLSKYLFASGIALAASIAMFFQTCLLGFYLLKIIKVNKKDILELLQSFLKYFVAFILTWVILYTLQDVWSQFHQLIKLIIVSIVTFSLYFLLAYLFKMKEIEMIQQIFFRRNINENPTHNNL